MRRVILTILISLAVLQVTAQRKFEFRGAWVATVANIDWPSNIGLTPDLQRREMVWLLDSLAAMHFNAIIFQVRPTSDAFYKSNIEPWSYYLTGRQNQAPDPFYDPLAFVIYEAHKRNIDVHIWINPYRVLNGGDVAMLSSSHIFFKKPYLFVKYGGKYYFNPGYDETRQYLTSVVEDIVRRYDIDAVHFDDYFYPYRVAGEEFPDQTTFNNYPRGFTDKNDWRRNNVNMVILEVGQAIKRIKPWVEFGISPFGVWRNYSSDASGSKTTAGTTNYDDLYADVRLWLKKGWIDYVAPQLYWEIGKKAADYKVLIEWWNNNSFGKNLYIGLYASGLEINKGEAWKKPNELCRQLRMNDKYQNVKGDIFYSCRPMLRNPQGICDSLYRNFYKYPALIPPNEELGGVAPAAPQNVRCEMMGVRQYLWWNAIEAEGGLAISMYVVYRFDENEEIDLTKTDRIVAMLHDNCMDLTNQKPGKYVVTAVNRYHYESEGSVAIIIN